MSQLHISISSYSPSIDAISLAVPGAPHINIGWSLMGRERKDSPNMNWIVSIARIPHGVATWCKGSCSHNPSSTPASTAPKDFPLLPQLFYHSKRLSSPFRQLFRRSHDDPTIQKAPLSSAGKRQASSLLRFERGEGGGGGKFCTQSRRSRGLRGRTSKN